MAFGPKTSVRNIPGATLFAMAVALLVALSPALTEALQFDRRAIAAGQLWRIVTCHWTHWSLDHWFWDSAALLALGILAERNGRRTFLLCVGASAVLIPACLWFLHPNLDIYRGLSGIDSAVFVLCAVMILRANLAAREWTWALLAVLLLGGFAAKTGFEVVTGATLFVDSAAANMTPIPSVHLAGAVVGCICGLWRRRAAGPFPQGQ
jgi:rhomboid family GlyGly-CTERM serine protease